MNYERKIKLFSGNSNLGLANEIAQNLGVKLGECTAKKFSDGETWVEVLENVRGRDVFVVQPTSNPANESLMELLILIDAFKRASAETITAIIPYYGYGRQERKTQPRTPISAKLVADLLTTAGATRVVSVDLHAGQIQGFFNIPFDHLFAMPVMLEYVRKNIVDDGVIVAPDAGGAERARAYAKRLKMPLALIDKRRPAPNVTEVMNVIGDVKNRTAIIIDDMIDTGGTLIRSVEALQENGAKKVYACCTHGVFSGEAISRINESSIEGVIATNTIATSKEVADSPKITILSVAPLLAEAIRRIYQADSISSLFV